MELKERIKELKENMLTDLAALVKHPSKRGEALPGKPFGEGPAAALAEALSIAERMGFRTKNLDNYCGYAEIGEGAIIAAGSVVLGGTKVGPHELWAGSPAKFKKMVDPKQASEINVKIAKNYLMYSTWYED